MALPEQPHLLVVIIVMLLQIVAIMSVGSFVLRLCISDAGIGRSTWLVLVFGLGVISYGWMLFWIGLIEDGYRSGYLLVLLVLMLTLAFRIPGSISGAGFGGQRKTGADWLTGAALCVILGLYVIEGLAPPTDADTNAYHLALPLQFYLEGETFPVPRAIDGLAPLLVQIGYLPSLHFAGIQGAVFWYVITGVVGGFAVYSLLRQRLNIHWSLLFSLLCLTTPAVVYGATTGQVGVRVALFVTGSALALIEARRTGNARWIVIAALLCGGYAGSKYLGLFFGVASVVTIIVMTKSVRQATVFILVAMVAGGQWYGWNWYITGDPLFPALSGLLPDGGMPFWNDDYAETLKSGIIAGEKAVPVNLFWLLAYPFVATFDGYPAFESGRTGLGIVLFLLLPFAIIGGVRRYKEQGGLKAFREEAVLIGLAGGFYLLWWFLGESQRIRHLVPVYPLMLGLMAWLASGSLVGRKAHWSLTAGLWMALAVQVGGLAYHARIPARVVLGQVEEGAFLHQQVVGYEAINWFNENDFEGREKLLLIERRNNIYIRKPFYRASSSLETLINLRDGQQDPVLLFRQVQEIGATHILVIWWTNVATGIENGEVIFADDIGSGAPVGTFDYLTYQLVKNGCARIVHASPTRRGFSRTLGGTERDEVAVVLELDPNRCRVPEGDTDGHETARELIRGR